MNEKEVRLILDALIRAIQHFELVHAAQDFIEATLITDESDCDRAMFEWALLEDFERAISLANYLLEEAQS